MTEEQHPIARQWLHALEVEAYARLPHDRATELVEDLRADLAERIHPGQSEAEVKTAIERLGQPSDLVTEAVGLPPVATAAAPIPNNTKEVAAIILLVASVLLGLFWPVSILMIIAGLILVMISPRFTALDKALSVITYLIVGGPTIIFGLIGASAYTVVSSCSATSDAAPQCIPVQQSGPPQWLIWTVIATVAALHLYTLYRLIRGARRTPAS